MAIRALIVDDEPLARRRIRAFLRWESDVEIAGECRNGEEAVQAIRTLRPGLVFLDVEMPVIDGFAVLRALDPELIPPIIFVTAHEQYAVRAFERRALDYLLKPFSRDRFHEAVERVRERLTTSSGAGVPGGMTHLLREIREIPEKRVSQRLAIKTSSRVVVIDPARIEWFEADGDYVRVHIGREVHLTRQTLNRLETQLATTRFARVHRSAIVNIHFLKEIHPLPGGDHALTLLDGTRLTLSRSYRQRLGRLLSLDV
jgi:two-component system LytT family response regulator